MRPAGCSTMIVFSLIAIVTSIALWLVYQGAFLGGVSASMPLSAEPRAAPLTVNPHDCGVACLFVVCRVNRNTKSLASIRELFAATDQPLSMLEIRNAAEACGYDVAAKRLTPRQLASRLAAQNVQAILYLPRGHFIVAAASRAEELVIIDPSVGTRLIPRVVLERAPYEWKGECLIVAADSV